MILQLAIGPNSNIADILNTWADFGVFAYVLPFLMIFAVVFGLVNKTKILGDNRAVQAVIAATLGLMALQFDYVSNFFATIFPYTGMGIAVLLVGLIFVGVFKPESGTLWAIVGGIIAIIIVITSLSEFSWWGGGYGLGFLANWPALLAVAVIVVVVLVIMGPPGKKEEKWVHK